MTTPQQAYELANTHDDYTADCLRSLADQLDAALEDRVALAMRVEALTQNLDGHKTQAAEDFALISRLTAERDKAIAFAQSAWSRGNASGYASNEQAMRKMEDAMLSERLDSNVTNEMLTDAVERAEAELDALRADAERYRHMRMNKTTIDAMKPLQWSEERQPCDECRYNHVVADSGLGRISIEWKGWKENDSHTVYVAGEHIGDEYVLEDAKQLAAQHLLNVVLSLTISREEAQTAEPVAYEVFSIKFANGTQLVYERPENLPSYVSFRPLFTHPTPPPSGERAALIAKLNAQECCQAHGGVGAAPGRCEDCPRTIADMLAADAQELEHTRKMYEQAVQGRSDFRQALREARGAQQVVNDGVWEALQRLIENAETLGQASKDDALLVAQWLGKFRSQSDGVTTKPAPQVTVPNGPVTWHGVKVCHRHDGSMYTEPTSITIAAPKPPQAERVPMTEVEISDMMPINSSMGREDTLRWVIRATERHHHIGVKP